MILVPPDAPTTRDTWPSSLTAIDGHIDERGRLRGLMKLAGDAGTPNELVVLGVEKSSISSL